MDDVIDTCKYRTMETMIIEVLKIYLKLVKHKMDLIWIWKSKHSNGFIPQLFDVKNYVAVGDKNKRRKKRRWVKIILPDKLYMFNIYGRVRFLQRSTIFSSIFSCVQGQPNCIIMKIWKLSFQIMKKNTDCFT